MSKEFGVSRVDPVTALPFLATDRRGFFVATGALLLAACGSEKERADIWSKERVLGLAEQMIAEGSEYPIISNAGRLLKASQTGEPSISGVSDLFIENPIDIMVKGNKNKFGLGSASSHVDGASSVVEVQLQPKDIRRVPYAIKGYSALKFGNITIDTDLFKSASNFLAMFMVAKEIYNVQAYEDLSKFFVREYIYTGYQEPQSPNLKNAVRTGILLGGNQNGVPFGLITDIWAHFYMMPDYLKAKEKGRFSQWDLDKSGVSTNLDQGTQYFQKGKILTRDENGDYTWIKDVNSRNNEWYYAASFVSSQIMKETGGKGLGK